MAGPEQKAEETKNLGNDFYKKGNYAEAIKCYSESIGKFVIPTVLHINISSIPPPSNPFHYNQVWHKLISPQN